MVEDIPTEQHMLVPSFIGGGRKRIHPLPYADPSLPWSFQVAEDGPLLCLEFQIQISLAPARWIVRVYYNLVLAHCCLQVKLNVSHTNFLYFLRILLIMLYLVNFCLWTLDQLYISIVDLEC